MYYYMSLCNITFLISLKSNYRFASNFVWMFLGWTPTRFATPIFNGIIGNYVHFSNS